MTSTPRPADKNTVNRSLLDPAIPEKQARLVWTGLSGDSLPLAIANLAQIHSSLVVVITPDMQSAELLQDQVEYFSTSSHSRVTTLPDWETLPPFSISPPRTLFPNVWQRFTSWLKCNVDC